MTDVSTEDLQAFKAAFFRALAHPVRIRILELLVRGERSVQELQEALGVDQPVVSQQLAVLRATNIVSGKKEGVSVRYTVRDPLIANLLDTARQIFNNHLVGTQDLLSSTEKRASSGLGSVLQSLASGACRWRTWNRCVRTRRSHRRHLLSDAGAQAGRLSGTFRAPRLRHDRCGLGWRLASEAFLAGRGRRRA